MERLLRQRWWKGLAAILLVYTIIGGFLMPVPRLNILHETIRNLYFHVPMWFGMILLLLFSVIQSLRFLGNSDFKADIMAVESARTGLLFGILGLATGMTWANFTWGDWWVNDPRLNGAVVGLLIYLSYFILRGSLTDELKRAKISSVYSIFAFVLFIIFIFVIPRMTDSLHPGVGGNPAFGQYDLDNRMRLVFYPAVFGWTLIGFWMVSLLVRIRLVEQKLEVESLNFTV